MKDNTFHPRDLSGCVLYIDVVTGEGLTVVERQRVVQRSSGDQGSTAVLHFGPTDPPLVRLLVETRLGGVGGEE